MTAPEHPAPLQRTTTPALLVPGDVILGAKDGREWTVAGVGNLEVTLQRTGHSVTVPLAKLPEQVQLVTTAAEAHERAVALAQVRLGGEVVAHRDADGPYRVPARFMDVASLLGHLYLFHQAPDRDPKVPAAWPQGPMDAVIRHHDELHGRTLVVPHVHEPAFYAQG